MSALLDLAFDLIARVWPGAAIGAVFALAASALGAHGRLAMVATAAGAFLGSWLAASRRADATDTITMDTIVNGLGALLALALCAIAYLYWMVFVIIAVIAAAFAVLTSK